MVWRTMLLYDQSLINMVLVKMVPIKPWRVRVTRAVESWVDVQAESSAQAENLARNLPHVLGVFRGSATRADRLASEGNLGVEDN